MLAQDQSILFTLPPELREDIYAYSLIADRPITNPGTTLLLVGQDDKDIPPLGIALLRSCRRVYDEIDSRTLYESNTFRFTRPMISTSFFNHLTNVQRALIRGISCDFRAVDGIKIGEEWLYYLSCTPRRHDPERGWIYHPEMIHVDIPGIETLTFDLTALQNIVDQHATLEKRNIQLLLLRILQEFHECHYCSVQRLARLQEVRVVGKDNSGNIVTLSTRWSCLPHQPAAYGQAAQALLKLACVGVDPWTGRLLPSAFNGTSSSLATSVRFRPGYTLGPLGTLSISEDQQYLFWQDSDVISGTWDTTVIQIGTWDTTAIEISRISRCEDHLEGLDGLTLALYVDRVHVFEFTDKNEGWSQYCTVKQIVEQSLSQKAISE
ncbi:hypothetical protein LTR10_011173 [Elasticomyces elasticus]|nr:hypothetical protein LTR10_011173 [Elasticomyces elasticus]